LVLGNGHRAPRDPSLATTESEVIEAADGDEGLRKHRGSGINLVITDTLMPEKEGLETIRELRQANSAVNVIAISCGDRGGNLS
jgi:YesN/AraC family two-component response regulator